MEPSPIEQKMFQALERSILIPKGVMRAYRYEWERDRPLVSLAILGLWESLIVFIALGLFGAIEKAFS